MGRIGLRAIRWHYDGMLEPPPAAWLLGMGLFLDIVGVVLLAVPDFPPVARWFRFGRLREAQHKILYGELRPGDTGIKDVVDIHNQHTPGTEISLDDLVHIEYGPNLYQYEDDEGNQQFSVTSEVNIEFPDDEGHRAKGTPPAIRAHPQTFYPLLIWYIERGERRFRLAGLGLIAGGFAVQLAAALVG